MDYVFKKYTKTIEGGVERKETQMEEKWAYQTIFYWRK